MEKRVYKGNFSQWTDDKEFYWEGGSVMGNFEKKGENLPEPEFIYAEYDIDGYDGSALVIFKEDGVWYSVSGSHCSCYGLEGQWAPEEFDPELQIKAMEENRSIVTGGYSMDMKAITEWLKEVTQST